MVVSILGAVALGLAVLGTSMSAATVYEIETSRAHVESANGLLREARERAERNLQLARGDPVAEARAQMVVDSLALLERRTNVAAVSRQVEQTKESFLEEEWRHFQLDLLLQGAGTGISKLGFGKVQDAYVRQSNWPPDPQKVLTSYDPQTRTLTRVMREDLRPELTIVRFRDELSDAFDIVLNGFDVLSSLAEEDQPPTARQALAQVREGLERLQDVRPLPSQVGAYLAASLVRQEQDLNPQIRGLPPEEQVAFLCQQASQRLQRMLGEEGDRQRAPVLLAAGEHLDCPSVPIAQAPAPPAPAPPQHQPQPGEAEPTLEPTPVVAPAPSPTQEEQPPEQVEPTPEPEPTPDTSWVDGVVADARRALVDGGVPEDLADIFLEDTRACLLDAASAGLARAEAIERCEGLIPRPEPAAVELQGRFDLVQRDVGPCLYSFAPASAGSIQINVDFASGQAQGALEGAGSGRRVGLSCQNETIDVVWSLNYHATFRGSVEPASGAVHMTGLVEGSNSIRAENCTRDARPAECLHIPVGPFQLPITISGSVDPSGQGSGTIVVEAGDYVTQGEWSAGG